VASYAPKFREAQNCRDKKLLIFFFAFPVSSGKFGKQSSRVRAAKTFFFGITVFLYQIENPQTHLGVGRQFYASLINRHSCIVTRGVPVPL